MNPYRYRICLIVFAFVLVCLASPVRADYIYTISYDPLTITLPTGFVLPFETDSFSFTVPSLILSPSAQTIPTPGASLYDFTFESINTISLGMNTLTFSQVGDFLPSLPTISVGGFRFTTDTWPNAVGSYVTSGGADRMVVLHVYYELTGDIYLGYWYSGNGSLTITEAANAVSEPATIFLLGSGLLGLWGLRKTSRSDIRIYRRN